MLSTRRLLAVSAALLSLMVAGAPSAHADAQAVCAGNAAIFSGCSSATVTVVVSAGGSDTAVSLSSGTPVCQFDGSPVPCSAGGAWWSSSRGCYVSKSDPQPSATDPVWEGHSDGTVYDCRLPVGVGGARHMSQFWSAVEPVSPAAVQNLAAQLVQTMNLQAIGVGMAPTPTSKDPASIGIVGMPNWMWVDSPSPQTWGPINRSAASGGLTVNVVARAQSVTWNMGDGSAPVVCAGPGTPYSASYGKAPSPTCGYSGYNRQGTYPVSALTHWVISYTSNVGISGSLALDLTSTVSVTIGELQTTVG